MAGADDVRFASGARGYIAPAMARTVPPPVMEARRWVETCKVDPDRPLLNLSQAAPSDPPPAAMRDAMAAMVRDDPTSHLYGPVLGLPALRERVAADWSGIYDGSVLPSQTAITSGCNQAFTGIVATLAGPGDNVVLPTPYYFNHKMWLDMTGVEAHLVETDGALLPDPAAVDAAINARTRAIVAVTPNNPGGVEYPAALLSDLRDVARRRGVVLIVDETYRDFHSREGPPHGLFDDPDWDDVLVHLYSFSKAYRLTGHRVGAVCASPPRLAELEKWLDTVAICPPQIGQRAALWGMENLGEWLAGERSEVLRRRTAIKAGFAARACWALVGCGAYFAYVRHPFDADAETVARRLVDEAAILVLPGTMFGPRVAEGGSGRAEATLRIAFANANDDGIATLFERLDGVGSTSI